MPHALGSGDWRDLHDVSHNIFKEEVHTVNKEQKRLLVHRKGATRAFPPGRKSDFKKKNTKLLILRRSVAGHAEVPAKYAEIGQPVLVGGSFGTCSYVLTGTTLVAYICEALSC